MHSISFQCIYIDWAELPEDVKAAWTTLGYTQELWDSDADAATEELEFEQLSEEQKAAALAIGYTEESWNTEE